MSASLKHCEWDRHIRRCAERCYRHFLLGNSRKLKHELYLCSHIAFVNTLDLSACESCSLPPFLARFAAARITVSLSKMISGKKCPHLNKDGVDIRTGFGVLGFPTLTPACFCDTTPYCRSDFLLLAATVSACWQWPKQFAIEEGSWPGCNWRFSSQQLRGEFKPPLIGTCELRTGNCKLFVDASIFFYHNLVKSLHRIYFDPVVAPSGNGVCIMTPRFLLSLSLPIFSIITITRSCNKKGNHIAERDRRRPPLCRRLKLLDKALAELPLVVQLRSNTASWFALDLVRATISQWSKRLGATGKVET